MYQKNRIEKGAGNQGSFLTAILLPASQKIMCRLMCAMQAKSCKPRTPASQLVQHVGVLKQPRLVHRVGLDAADVVWLHEVQGGHQLSQLLLELGAH